MKKRKHRRRGNRLQANILAFPALLAKITALLMVATANARDYSAEVVRVVDGDTVVANIRLGFDMELRGQYIRLANANAPESGGPLGRASRDWLAAKLQGQWIKLTTKDAAERDKYGRILGRIELNGEDIGEAAKLAGMAHGGPGVKDPPEPKIIHK